MHSLCAGMKKLTHFSEGVRESLRRFSNVIWMAEELHRVADFYLSNRSVSVHDEIHDSQRQNDTNYQYRIKKELPNHAI